MKHKITALAAAILLLISCCAIAQAGAQPDALVDARAQDGGHRVRMIREVPQGGLPHGGAVPIEGLGIDPQAASRAAGYSPYRDMLGANDQAAYDALYRCLATPFVTVGETVAQNSVDLSAYAIPISIRTDSQGAYIDDAGSARLMRLIDSVIFDHPEIWWLDQENWAFEWHATSGDIGDAIVTTLVPGFSNLASDPGTLAASQARFDAATATVLAEARREQEPAGQEKVVHDWLASSVRYQVSPPIDQYAYGAIVDRQAVCAGYASAFQYLMGQLGVPCAYVSGTSRSVPHAWNIVQLGGDWYAVDATWDATSSGEASHTYFNVTDSFLASDHARDSMSAPLPAASGTTYGYSYFVPTPTASATATQAPTASPTVSATATQAPTASPTVSATATQAPTASPTVSATATQEATASPTPGATGTQEPTSSPTSGATGTQDPTSSPTAAATGTQKPTPSRTASATSSPGSTQSPTAGATAGPTGSPSSTQTSVATQTASAPSSPDRTPGPTASCSPTSGSSSTPGPSQGPPNPTPAPTGPAVTSPSGLEWSRNPDGVSVDGYTGSEEAIVEIPAVLDEREVTRISDGAFSGNEHIEGVVIPITVTSIGDEAFSGCTGLEEVDFPFSVKSIGDGAFEGTGIGDLQLGAWLETIGDGAFKGCNRLLSVSVPDGVTSIGRDAFADCAALGRVVLPASLEHLDKDAFSGCGVLSEIHFAGTREQFEAMGGPEAVPDGVSVRYEADAASVRMPFQPPSAIVASEDSGLGFERLGRHEYATGIEAGSAGQPATAASVLETLSQSNACVEAIVSDSAGEPKQGSQPAGTGDVLTVTMDGRRVLDCQLILKGDVMGSGQVGLAQLVRIAGTMTGGAELDGPYLLAADFNEDGTISLSDLVAEANLYRAGIVA